MVMMMAMIARGLRKGQSTAGGSKDGGAGRGVGGYSGEGRGGAWRLLQVTFMVGAEMVGRGRAGRGGAGRGGYCRWRSSITATTLTTHHADITAAPTNGRMTYYPPVQINYGL
ncbi:hypothetical protein Pcinc_040192 [Petrolisthes cinctipes]|uniref:Uncharacterized protein n=1 Tax=Petrolisthes cinctipes TaxID=88211 RepID=A0AAE1BME4_PETCI|nr:hypothetical protein Pcinc_040192 [Petrolisthes cinctipes]